jgi:hypothetical protein
VSRTLTLKTLIDKGACDAQVELFRAKFGESVRVTQRLCVSVVDAFDWNWAARHLLSAPALAEYRRVKAAAWAEYRRVKAAAPAEYGRVAAAAWAEYRRVTAAAPAEYGRVTARTFAKLYNQNRYLRGAESDS